MAEAAAKAVKSGTDLTCGNEYLALSDAVQKGFITEEEINQSVRRLFVARIRLGLFDPPAKVPYSTFGVDQIASEPHQKLALEAASSPPFGQGSVSVRVREDADLDLDEIREYWSTSREKT